MNFQLTFQNLNADGLRPLVRKLRHTFDRRFQFVLLHDQSVRVFFRKHPLVIGKIARQFPAQQQALVDPKEQMIVVARELNRLTRIVASELLDLAHGLLRQQGPV